MESIHANTFHGTEVLNLSDNFMQTAFSVSVVKDFLLYPWQTATLGEQVVLLICSDSAGIYFIMGHFSNAWEFLSMK